LVEPHCTVDTNVLLRYLIGDVANQYEAARAMLAGLDGGEQPVFCDPATVVETVHALRKFYGFEPENIASTLLPLLEARGFVMPHKSRYIHALELYATTVPHFGDACACAAAMEQTEGRLYSFDKKLSRVEGVTRLERPPKQ
jgi:predicted nucleic-acid-binding protein